MSSTPQQQGLTYASTGVRYDIMDPFKRKCQQRASRTAGNARRLDVNPLEETRGESAYLVRIGGRIYGHVNEGLGTKNLVADLFRMELAEKLRPYSGKSYYDAIAKDTVAMGVNDLITVGSMPATLAMHLAVGSSDWFKDEQRVTELVEGWGGACDEARCIWCGGETPTLGGIIMPEAALLSCSVMGVDQSGEVFDPKNISAGDAIVICDSNGIHANGLSAARKLAQSLENGYLTAMPNGDSFGEALLRPTHIYVDIVSDCIQHNVKIKYAMNITGHGWAKFMRAPQPFTYVLDGDLPPVPPVLEFMQKRGGISDEEMYTTYNMGAGFALIIDKSHVGKFIDMNKFAVTPRRYATRIAGHVVASKSRTVVIPSKGLTLDESKIQIR